jgi:cysteine desulfurase family protein (TIGR01976 family)
MLDGAGGTHVPDAVVEAVSSGLREAMANLGGRFEASERSAAVLAGARQALADLIGGRPEGVVVGPNMTTLTFHLADALSAEWGEGDEVVVTSLDHDANVRPWVLAAADAGATVRWAELDTETGELPPERFDELIGERTRLVAVTAASNAIGTRPDVRAIADRAHAHGALVYVDGVHATPHVATDADALGADLYACSSYKFFGPHTGCVVAAPELIEGLTPRKLAPAPNTGPSRLERGTGSFEQYAGVTAAIDWIAGLAEFEGNRRERLLAAFGEIEGRLEPLLARALDGLGAIDGVRLLPAPERRTPTISFTVAGHAPRAVAEWLGERDVYVWHGDYYAYELMRRFELPDGAVRASIVLYNDEDDVDRLVRGVEELAAS